MNAKIGIGEVAALFDITTKTLRHYEKLGLIEPERAGNGYRQYSPEDVLRVQKIRQLQSLGLSLHEIARLLGQDDELLWADVLRSLRADVAAQLELLEERLDRLEELLDAELPPAQERLPSLDDRVNEYLEQHLPQARLGEWRRDQRVYASLHGLVDDGLGNQTYEPAYRLQLMPGQPGSAPVYGEATSNGNGYRAIDAESLPEVEIWQRLLLRRTRRVTTMETDR
jgi:DNA-binding transcriptional MerR regulator